MGENSYVSQTNFVCLPDPHPFSTIELFNCAPARRVVRALFCRWFGAKHNIMLIAGGDMLCQTSPSGALRHLPLRGRHLTLPLPFVGKRKRKPVRCAEIIDFFDSLKESGKTPVFPLLSLFRNLQIRQTLTPNARQSASSPP